MQISFVSGNYIAALFLLLFHIVNEQKKTIADYLSLFVLVQPLKGKNKKPTLSTVTHPLKHSAHLCPADSLWGRMDIVNSKSVVSLCTLFWSVYINTFSLHLLSQTFTLLSYCVRIMLGRQNSHNRSLCICIWSKWPNALNINFTKAGRLLHTQHCLSTSIFPLQACVLRMKPLYFYGLSYLTQSVTTVS